MSRRERIQLGLCLAFITFMIFAVYKGWITAEMLVDLVDDLDFEP